MSTVMSGPEPVDDQADEPEPCCPEEDRYWQPCGLDCRIYDTSAT